MPKNYEGCYTCMYNLGGNERGFCNCPPRLYEGEEKTFSEITAEKEEKGVYCGCEFAIQLPEVD